MSEALSHYANSRFHYVEPPFPLPGKCAVCGNVKRPVIDFGASIELYGAVLLCITCVAEAYEVLIRESIVEVPQTINVSEIEVATQRMKNEFRDNLDRIHSMLDVYSSVLSDSDEQVARAKYQNDSPDADRAVKTAERSDQSTGHLARNKGPSGVSDGNVNGSVFG